jgi:hypothetical protein
MPDIVTQDMQVAVYNTGAGPVEVRTQVTVIGPMVTPPPPLPEPKTPEVVEAVKGWLARRERGWSSDYPGLEETIARALGELEADDEDAAYDYDDPDDLDDEDTDR